MLRNEQSFASFKSDVEEQDCLLVVIHENDHISLDLSKYSTISELKNEVSKHFHIDPECQTFEGWATEPENDQNILLSCINEEITYLILKDAKSCDKRISLTTLDSDGDVVVDDFTSNVMYKYITDDDNVVDGEGSPMEQESETDSLEILSTLSFIEDFLNNYTESNLTLHTCRLQDAVSHEALNNTLNKRKVLILYLHVKGSDFAKQFCNFLVKKEVTKLIESDFFLLGWSMEDKYQSALIKALNGVDSLSNLTNFIEKKIPAALIAVPINGLISLYSCIRTKFSEKDLLTTLKNADAYLKQEYQEEQDLLDIVADVGTNNDLGSSEYQQMMFEGLCDRDFDSFEANEHESLKSKIGFALYGPPQEETGYNTKQDKHIDSIYQCILKQNYEKYQGRAVVSFIYNCTEPLPAEKCKRAKKFKDYNPNTDLCPRPIFVVRKCRKSTNGRACVIYIDDTSRTYETWADYINRNKLPPCVMVLPKDGRYQCDDHGKVILEQRLSPECGVGTKILQGTDIASTAVGLVSGGIAIAAAIPAVVVAPVALATAAVAGAGVGVYSICRSAYTLYDKNKHKESLSFTNSEARGAYISIVAGSLGFVGAGANVAVSQLVSNGVNISKGAAVALNTLGAINIGANGAGIVNSSYDIIFKWVTDKEAPSTLVVLQLSSSILFFGHAVYNFKLVGTVIDETQSKVLKEYSDSLRSNRHRKTFNKLKVATIKGNEGDVRTGQAQVIKAIRNISNKDEVFAALTRNNKEMNKTGIKFTAENGEIKLDGKTINMSEFMTMNKNDVKIYLTNLPKAPELTPTEINNATTTISTSFNITKEEAFRAIQVVIKLIEFCRGDIKTKIFKLVAELFCSYLEKEVSVITSLLKISPAVNTVFYPLAMFANDYFQKKVRELEEKYDNWLRTGDKIYYNPLFDLPGINGVVCARRMQQFFDFAVNIFFNNGRISRKLMEEMLESFYNWLTKKLFEYEQKRERTQIRSENAKVNATKNDCKVCCGYYYTVKN